MKNYTSNRIMRALSYSGGEGLNPSPPAFSLTGFIMYFSITNIGHRTGKQASTKKVCVAAPKQAKTCDGNTSIS